MKFLKFSSLVRFVFTGGFASAIGYLMYYLNSDLFCSAKSCCGNTTADNTALDFLSSIGGIEITITIAVMYF